MVALVLFTGLLNLELLKRGLLVALTEWGNKGEAKQCGGEEG